MKWIRIVSIGLGSLLICSCASKPPEHAVVLTGNILVDGPNAIEHGPPRDKVLWEYRTSAAAMRAGKFDIARKYLDDALTMLQGVYGPDPSARKARGYFHSEAKKTFIGEPYERAMAYFYRGILYWMDGEPDNARACFRSAEVEDSDTQNHDYAGDWVLPDYLDGLATAKLGGDGAEACKRAQASAKSCQLPACDPKANVLVFIEFGPGPTKYATGEYSQELRFHVTESPVHKAEMRIDGKDFPVASADDVWFQATTRGGRVMDHILGNKAVFKTATDIAGTVALIGGGAAIVSHDGRDATANEIGAGLIAAGVISKLFSAATTPEADVRSWDNLPRYLGFISLALPPGAHAATVQFLNAQGHAIAGMTKSLTVDLPPGSKDKVIFVSDQSLTPQNL
jgi:hypothetical protein